MPQTMKREDGTFSREDFTFDKDRNVYICPGYGWFTEGFDPGIRLVHRRI